MRRWGAGDHRLLKDHKNETDGPHEARHGATLLYPATNPDLPVIAPSGGVLKQAPPRRAAPIGQRIRATPLLLAEFGSVFFQLCSADRSGALDGALPAVSVGGRAASAPPLCARRVRRVRAHATKRPRGRRAFACARAPSARDLCTAHMCARAPRMPAPARSGMRSRNAAGGRVSSESMELADIFRDLRRARSLGVGPRESHQVELLRHGCR